MDSRYKVIDTLNLQEIEEELAFLFTLNPDTMSDETAEYINSLIGLANALGTRRYTKMTIKVLLKTGEFISPSFPPEHKAKVIEFYEMMMDKGEILSWELVR